MKYLVRSALILAGLLFTANLVALAGEPITLHTRARPRPAADATTPPIVEKQVQWDPARTAVVICDMWDKHHCPDATERVGEMAPRMNEVLKAARDRGMLIIHCPSDTLGFYQDHPGRKLAQAAPKVETQVPLQGWCSLNGVKEPPLPIDDSDGGCDGCPECPGYGAWKRQHPALEIMDGDAITDSAEAFYLMRQRGITDVIVMGVHINMCVLGRPFAIRQMVAQGQNVLLMRDLTDSMYNHRKPPYVSHFRGTELVVEHIEQYWCPSITSADFLGGEPFRFRGDVKKRIAMIIGENEYHTSETLPEFGRKELEWRGYQVSYVLASPTDGDSNFKNFEAIRGADLVVVSVRRRTPPKAMMDLLRTHVAAGKPIVGIRTASHAFDAAPASADFAAWPTFDVDVFGGHYEGHYGNKPPAAPHTVIEPVSANASHLVLTGVKSAPFRVTSHLYKNRNLSANTVPLLHGRVEGKDSVEPVAWVNTAQDRRTFYTSLGNLEDFQLPAFRRLLLNGILWCLHDPLPPPSPEPVDYAGTWQTMPVPGTWEDNSEGRLARYDGFAWYRCRVEIPAAWRGQELQLEVSDVDNAHESFVDGIKVGSAGSLPPDYTNASATKGSYSIAATLAGQDQGLWIALRVYDHDGRGGFKGAAPSVHRSDESIKLAGQWDFRTGDDATWSKYDASRAAGTKVFSQAQTTPAPLAAPTTPAASALDLPQEANAPALSPKAASTRFQVADDLEWEQVLAEPLIAQPVFLNFDERGRMWVVEYRQYPWPAGLKMVSHDSVWRAVYDRVPPPPPNHFHGADRITIHEDSDGDGTFDRHKTFLDGLNIVTSVERGRGGVWVLNPPYLLFYPDANNDDVPDGDPEVRLSGFGLEDTHSVANSLRWGPDGWLYGAQGSTVTANILVPGADGKAKNPKPIYSQGQNIWRYHPERRIYEVFSEGGGNAFGCEIDSKGRIFSGHNGGDTRGFHYLQGAYLQKGFEKHGPLSNPFAFGYFPAMPHGREPRFTHNFVIYDHGALPPRYEGKLFGVEPLQGRIVESEVIPDRSSFLTRDVSRPVTSDDRWFRPVDIKVGPDGAIYVCDWYDQQVNHYRNHEGKLDTNNGRIYRLRAKVQSPKSKVQSPEDLSKLASTQLIERLAHTNRWVRQTALRLLADRRDTSLLPALSSALHRSSGQLALETLWALNLCGGLTETEALKALDHSDPFVRLWTVRLIGDAPPVSAAAAGKLVRLAAKEPNLEVRNQLAATAKRLPARESLAVVRALALRPEDTDDNRLPLLLWWAIEAQCEDHRDAVLQLYADPSFWRSPLVETHLVERTARRFAQAGSRRDLLTCARLFELSPSVEDSRRLMAGFEAAFKGRPLAGLPDQLVKAMARDGVGSAAFALRQGDPRAVRKAIQVVPDETAPRAERLEYLGVMSEVKVPGAVPALSRACRGVYKDDALRKAILSAFQNYDDPAIADVVLSVYPALGRESLPTAQTLLASRPAWALKFVQSINSKGISWSGFGIKPETIPLNIVRKLKQQRNSELQVLLEKIWPNTGSPTTADMEKKIQQLAGVIRGGNGDPYSGRTLFQNTCGNCHKLFSQGAEVGPDLTVYNRADLESMLLAIVNPSAEIREGFENYSVETKDDRSLSGFLVEQDNQIIVLRGLDNQNVTLARADLVELKPVSLSLMPVGLLDGFNEQQTRDLFAYLRSTQPLVSEPPRTTANR